jgi:hypothetical protein
MQHPIPDQKGWSRLKLGLYTADVCLIQTILALLVLLITLTARNKYAVSSSDHR